MNANSAEDKEKTAFFPASLNNIVRNTKVPTAPLSKILSKERLGTLDFTYNLKAILITFVP